MPDRQAPPGAAEAELARLRRRVAELEALATIRAPVETGPLNLEADDSIDTFQQAGPSEPQVLAAIADPSARIVAATEQFGTLLGLSAAEMIGASVDALGDAHPAALLRTDARRQLLAGQSVRLERLCYAASGRELWLDITHFPVLGPGGHLRQVVGFYRDITVGRRAEAALQRRIEAVQTLAESEPVFAACFVAPLEMEGASAFGADWPAPEQLLPPSMVAAWSEAFVRALETGQSEAFDYAISSTWETCWYQAELVIERVAGSERRGVAFTIRDITERRRAREALQAAEAELQAIHAAAEPSMFVIDRDHSIRAFNDLARDRAVALYGQALTPGVSLMSFTRDNERPTLASHVAVAFSGEAIQIERKVPGHAGTEHWFSVSYSPVIGPDGVDCVCFSAVDVTDRRRNARDSAHSEARFRSLVQNSSDIICVLDRRGRTRYVSPSAERVLGYRPELLMGVSPLDFVHPDDHKAVRAAMARVQARPGLVLDLELRLRHARGDWVDVEAVGMNLLADPTIQGLVLNGRDITERKRAQALSRLLTEASAALAQSLDAEALLTDVARLALPTLADWCVIAIDGRSGAGGMTIVAHADERRAADIGERWRAAGAGRLDGPVARALESRRPQVLAAVDADDLAALLALPEGTPDPAVTPWAALILPLAAHDRLFGVWVFARARPDQDYLPAERELAEELARRAALALDHARLYREAQEAIRMREEFVSIASHELRTPLTTVKGYVQFLTNQLRQPDWERERISWLTHQLQRQVSRLEVLVGDLLDASRIQQGRLELRPESVDLSQLARQVLDHFELVPERTDLHTLVLDAPEPTPGLYDPNRLDQVMTNLISNAIKYSPAGGEVRMTIRRLDDGAEIIVSDQGVGIPLAEQAGLFRPFARSETVRRSVNGVGLGLYITAQIVGRHGGTIAVRSELGEGSAFIVRLPNRPSV